MKNLKSRAIWIIGFAALLIMCMPILAMAKEAEYVPALFGSVWSLLPPFVAIILALITKEATEGAIVISTEKLAKVMDMRKAEAIKVCIGCHYDKRGKQKKYYIEDVSKKLAARRCL